MFKSPVTDKGELRYFEIVKYIIITTLSVVLLSLFINQNPTQFAQSGSVIAAILNALFVIQIALVILSAIRDIHDVIAQFNMCELIHFNMSLKPVQKDDINTSYQPLNIKRMNVIQLLAIRC